MRVQTGKGAIPAMVVVAIWSLSLGINLPGLAVTPVLQNLTHYFPNVSEFQTQLLTVLPNLVIIPFVLISGRLSLTTHKIPVIAAGVVLYVLAGLLYLLSKTFDGLIWISCLLGAGCGLLLPFTTGLIADVFTGKYKLRQMGIVSAIGNIALVAATFVVGFLANVNWHLPFLVYVLPVISLILLPWLKRIPKDDLNLDEDGNPIGQDNAAQTAAMASNRQQAAQTAEDDADFPTAGQKVVGGFYLGRTIWTLLAYFFFVFATSVPAYYLPYLAPQLKISVEEVSIITSVIYFAMFVIGLSLNSVLRVFKSMSFIVSGGLLLVGFVLFLAMHSLVGFIVAAALVGLGQGMAQPIFFDKATEICVNNSHATLSMAYLQVANYVAIAIVPVIINLFMDIFGVPKDNNTFPFLLNVIFMAIVYFFIIIRYKHFTFGIHKAYYE